MIAYLSEEVKIPLFPKRKISAWIKQVSLLYGYKVGDVSYIFCSDKKILAINQQYLQHDYYTDIITFDYTENSHISGDIFISLETVATNAQKFKVSFQQELYRVLIHGVLHLCGQADKTNDERNEMTRKENEALKILQQTIENTL